MLETAAARHGLRVERHDGSSIPAARRFAALGLVERSHREVLKMSAGEAYAAAEAMLSELDVQDTTYVMLLHEERLAGFAASRRVMEETLWVRYLLELHMDERYRRKGLGRSLVADVRSVGEMEGPCGLMLTCDQRRTVAHKFYATCGFVVSPCSPSSQPTPTHMRGRTDRGASGYSILVLMWGDGAMQTLTEQSRCMWTPQHDIASPPPTVMKPKRPRPHSESDSSSSDSPPSEVEHSAMGKQQRAGPPEHTEQPCTSIQEGHPAAACGGAMGFVTPRRVS